MLPIFMHWGKVQKAESSRVGMAVLVDKMGCKALNFTLSTTSVSE
jgi:hypothetical protein